MRTCSWGQASGSPVCRRLAGECAADIRRACSLILFSNIHPLSIYISASNFEYICGEDPVVGSVLTERVVRGIQDQGVIANAKHWINNEIEESRNFVSANVDERTRYEIYYPPFQAAIDAGVLSVMCSYNRINDVHACQNPETLGNLKDMGFEGWVMSDW